MRFTTTASLLAISASLLIQSAQGAVTWRFSGTIATVDPALGTEVVPGDAWQIDVTFDDSAGPIGNFGSSAFYGIQQSTLTYFATGGDLVATSTLNDLNHSISVQNDSGGRDFFTVDFSHGGGTPGLVPFSLNGEEIFDFNLSLSDFTQTAFNSTALPTSIDLNDFSLRQGRSQFGDSGFDVTYNVSDFTIVPEPQTFAIPALIAAGVFYIRRRKQ
ncbi:hypothetical protein [Cerasicoccus fimbriatus]|uniref:hypothetical protein n=1 Tax=Cerasicoccus fimbriatus TaxID=3014554 RepID=UPI0022B39352|nr:hypothetical protein [Cerasicoccus sp. TK19100]